MNFKRCIKISLRKSKLNRASKATDLIIIIFVYCRLTHATEQKILPQQAEISGVIVA